MLLWNDLNGSVVIKPTAKKFYNKYLNKIVVFCPGARVINDKKSSQTVQDALVVRKDRVNYLKRIYNYTYLQNERLEESDVYQLEELERIKLDRVKSGVKIRIEEPYVCVYSNDDNILYELAKKLDRKRLIEVHIPESDAATAILNNGEIVAKSEPEFPFKVMLKEHWRLGDSAKQGILDYLYNLGDDEVCLTKGLVRHLNNHSEWFPGGYFYTKDEKIVTFINLIAPGIVGGIFKMSKPAQ